MNKTLHVAVVLCFCMVLGCGRLGEEAQVEAAYSRYIQAFESADAEALKQTTTEEMYPLAVLGLNAAKAFGIDLSGMHVSHAVDEIKGDTAYVNTESTFQGVTRHERVVLKKQRGAWLVSGKQ